jgi:hypothetical protein
VYARSIATDDSTVLSHPAAWTPLACLAQQAWNSTLDVISVMAIAWGLETVYVSVKSYAAIDMPMYAVEWLHWLLLLLQMRVHSTQMACCEDNQGVAAAIRRA